MKLDTQPPILMATFSTGEGDKYLHMIFAWPFDAEPLVGLRGVKVRGISKGMECHLYKRGEEIDLSAAAAPIDAERVKAMTPQFGGHPLGMMLDLLRDGDCCHMVLEYHSAVEGIPTIEFMPSFDVRTTAQL